MKPPHIEAEVEFLAAQEGGRRTPAFSGYRPQFYYDGNDWDAQHTYPDVESVLPGDKVRVHLLFTLPEVHFGKVFVGMPFLVREGVRTVARGTITEIYDQLETDAARRCV